MFEIQSNISFNWQAAWDDLFKRLIELADQWGRLLADAMDVQRMYYFDFEMEHEIRGEIGRIIVDIFPTGDEAWEAWLEEFGKGSLMADDNPYIGEYKGSAYWNTLRGDDPTIVGRAEGEYLGIDGRQHASTGGMAGLDLEEYAALTGNEDYAPTPPTYFIRDTLQAYRGSLYKDIQNVVADWGANLARFFTS